MSDRIDHGAIGLTRTMGIGIGHGHPTTMVDSKEMLGRRTALTTVRLLLITWLLVSGWL
jgi:hypothetical protein